MRCHQDEKQFNKLKLFFLCAFSTPLFHTIKQIALCVFCDAYLCVYSVCASSISIISVIYFQYSIKNWQQKSKTKFATLIRTIKLKTCLIYDIVFLLWFFFLSQHFLFSTYILYRNMLWQWMLWKNSSKCIDTSM